MRYALKHHRAVVDRIVKLHESDYDAKTGKEPVSQKARDNAMHFLSRRPDLAIGMSVAATRSGGLKLDVLRFGREFLIEIDDGGRASLLSGTDTQGLDPVTVSTRAINQVFLAQVELHMPDPLEHDDRARQLVPAAGELKKSSLDLPGYFHVMSDRGSFLGLEGKNTRYGFDITCFRIPRQVTLVADRICEIIAAIVESGKGILMARRSHESCLVSLYDIGTFPTQILGNAILPCGRRICDVQREVSESRARA